VDNQQQILNFIQEFNDHWIHARVDKTSPLLHEDVVFTGPDFKTQIRGKSACLKTLKDYVSIGYTHHFETTNILIDNWENLSICIIEYIIDYEIKGKRYKEKGFEQWIILKNDVNFVLTSRTILKTEILP